MQKKKEERRETSPSDFFLADRKKNRDGGHWLSRVVW